MTTRKPKDEKKRVETLKPGTRSLFEAIESFLQLTYMIPVPGINVPRRLFHIDIFSESAIEEFILHIKLAERPYVGNNKREHNTNSSSLNNRTESVSVIKTRNLSIAFGHKTNLEALNGPIKLFCPEHPFGTNNICVVRSRNENPGAIMLQSLNFFINGSKPCRILSNRLESFRLGEGKKSIEKPRGA